MKKEKNKKDKKKKNKVGKSIYKTPILSIADNIVFTKTGAWAYFKLSDKPYHFLSQGAKLSLANSTCQALAALSRNDDKKVECHLLIVNTPFEPDDWADQMKEQFDKMEQKQIEIQYDKEHGLDVLQSRTPFDNFVEATRQDFHREGFAKRTAYLGIKLFARGSFDFNISPFELGIKEALSLYKKSLGNLIHLPDETITADEESRAREAEGNLYNTLSLGSLDARRPTLNEILLLVKRRYYPAMPVPYLDIDHENRVGLSDIALETGGEITVKPRGLEMTQLIDGDLYTGYRSTLTVSDLPKVMNIPLAIAPLFNRASIMPFTCSARFTLTPTEEMKKDRQKKKLEADDEYENLASSGQGVTENIRNKMTDLEIMDQELTNRKEPWVTGTYNITIEAINEEIANEIISAIKQEYREDGINLTLTVGDQLDLFRQEQIGGEMILKTFQHTTNLPILAVTGMNHGGNVGDPVVQRRGR